MVLLRKTAPPPPPAKHEIHVVVLGGEKAGKSTLISQLVYSLADPIVLQREEKGSQELIAAHGDAKTWVAKKLREPIGFTRVPLVYQLETEKHKVFIEGCTGQKGFVDNVVIRGRRSKDIHVGVVVVAPGVRFPTDAIDSAAKQQIALAKTLGFKNLIIALNRMDLAKYSLATFNQMKYELDLYLKEIGYAADDVTIVPISALENENLVENTGKMKWYMGTTILNQPTLLEAIHNSDRSKVTTEPSDTPYADSFTVLAAAQEDIDIGFSGKFRILPDNAEIIKETKVEAVVEDILVKINNETGATFSDCEKGLKKGQLGLLKLRLSEPVVATTSYACPPLSKFHCMNNHIIRLAGIVTPDVERKGLIWNPTHFLERSFFFI